ncbi:M3 family metallopeptidase [Pseudomonas mosselii]|uniref:M3 family metallopeptidase n=1 Tax=Pseudomonas mosselii TaxID=78327 RepID=UPI00244A7334|nr:M3 family metallopeptidase [Pseudomonas mosselii]MDH1658545.1 M3 family metallopeptidase [Pseudomonas mosselii]MDH1715849.1 M3 family metallopeptidase [Pseudomonas mosselii]MDH1721306.1 M3 family metallopeptidase [Pseudomonas mosselii]
MTHPFVFLHGRLLDYASLRPEQLEPAVRQIHDANLTALERIVADQAHVPGWNDLVLAIERLDQRLEDTFHSLVPLAYEGGDWADAVGACHGLLGEWKRRKHECPGLLQAYQRIDQATLDTEQRVVLSMLLRDFRLGGFQLEGAERAQLRATEAAITGLERQFMSNLRSARSAGARLLTDESQLSGLDGQQRQRLRDNAEEEELDGWLVDLGETTVEAILESADDRSLRAWVYRASRSLATDPEHDNAQVMQALLRLRHERAQLLGLANAAEVGLELKAARTTREVETFIDSLIEENRPRLQADLEELQERAGQLGMGTLEPWDIAYLTRQLRDDAVAGLHLRDRFPLDTALTALRELHERLFDIRMVPHAVAGWHADVQVLEVREQGSVLGYIYLDLHARPGKLSWPYCYPMRQRHVDADGALTLPTILLSCSFAHGTDGSTSHLGHSDLCKLHHEFGHALHQILVTHRHRRLNRTLPAILGPDSCEFVGILFEQWCWSAPALQGVTTLMADTAPVPLEALRRWLASRRRLRGVAEAEKLRRAWFDFVAHRDRDARLDLQDLARQASHLVGLPAAFVQERFAESFDYLVTGYEAGYYSYKWAQVHAIDAFTRFEAQGVDQREVARLMRRELMTKIALRGLSASFNAFVGRGLSLAAYRDWHQPA